MTKKETVKWLTNLIEDIGKSEYGGLWHYEQALSEIKEILEKDGWTPCSERLPDCEQEVLICTEKKLLGQNAYIDQIVTPAIYEDGTMPECDSKWSWIDMDFDEWDEENDCGIILKGWWENRHFNRDEEYNNPVDRKVVAWMPLPGPWEGERE